MDDSAPGLEVSINYAAISIADSESAQVFIRRERARSRPKARIHSAGPSQSDFLHSSLKRVFDVAGALTLALVFSPVLLFVLISLYQGGGSPLFSHTRIGRGGKAFKVLKFRTMVPNANQLLRQLLAEDPVLRAEWQRDHKLKSDPRITCIGRFLRKTSLDELPQLINVLRGEMSLVGPRPIVRDEIKKYGRAARHYLSAKPGLTGIWQVSGRNDTNYRRRVAMDRLYATKANLGLDVTVLLKTIGVVLFRRGAY